MPWQLLIAISVLLYSSSVILQRVLLKEQSSRPIAFSILFQLLTGLFLGVVGLLFADMRLPSRLIDLWPNLLIMTVFYGLANVCIFSSLKRTEASRFTVVFSTRAFFTALGSSIFLRELLIGRQFLGAALIFAGIVVVNLQSKKFVFGRGEMLALLAAVLFGLANTNDRFLLSAFQVYPFTTLAFIAPALMTALMFPREIAHMRVFLSGSVLKKVVFLCAIYGLAAVTFFAALQKTTNSSQLATINLTSVVLVVLFAAVFLKEREYLAKKVFGALLSFVGLLLMR